MKNRKLFTTVTVAMLSALAFVLMLLEFPIVPGSTHLKLDFGDIPALIGGIMFGPFATVLIELVKNTLELLVKGIGTQMGFGNLMNFLVGCAYCVPFIPVYKKLSKTKKPSVAISVASVVGIVSIVLIGFFGNYLIAPFYFKYFVKIELSHADLMAAVWSATALNLIKGVMLSVVSFPVINVILKQVDKIREQYK